MTLKWHKYLSGDVVQVYCTVGEQKKVLRPAVVISKKSYQELYDELVIVPVVTRQPEGQLSMSPIRDWQMTGLPGPAAVALLARVIPAPAVHSKSGMLSERDRRDMRLKLGELWGLYGDPSEDKERESAEVEAREQRRREAQREEARRRSQQQVEEAKAKRAAVREGARSGERTADLTIEQTQEQGSASSEKKTD